MKNVFLLLNLILLQTTLLLSQDRYALADQNAKDANGTTIERLHSSLVKGLDSDELKARAFYRWIADHIAYDIHEARSSAPDIKSQSVISVLKSGKAVCHGYSVLFRELCNLSGIKCHLVSGYHKQDGIFDATGHTWNMIFIDGRWQPVDVTWAAGGVTGNKFVKDFSNDYFLADPEKFLSDHYPFDPMWQLVPFPVKLESYKQRSSGIPMVKSNVSFAFADTIAKWEQADSLEAALNSAERSVRFNPSDKMASRQLGYVKVNMGNREFAKGNRLIEKMYGTKTSSARNPPDPAALDSIEHYFLKAENFYRNADTGSAFDNQVIKSNLSALQANLKMIRSEKARLKSGK